MNDDATDVAVVKPSSLDELKKLQNEILTRAKNAYRGKRRPYIACRLYVALYQECTCWMPETELHKFRSLESAEAYLGMSLNCVIVHNGKALLIRKTSGLEKSEPVTLQELETKGWL